jgi:tetratricopeptide (TPR) repeat protein
MRIGRADRGPTGAGLVFFCARLELTAAYVMVAVAVWLAIDLLKLSATVRAQEARPDKAGNEALEPGAVRSQLVVIRQRAGQGKRALVVLGRPAYGGFSAKAAGEVDQAILPRELVRQAMLIAARDELGLSTRDEVIDDSAAEGEGMPAATAEVVSYIRDHVWHAQVRRAGGNQRKHLCDAETQASKGRIVDLLSLTVAAEALSRQEFPRVLKELGLEGKPNDRKETIEPPLPRYVEARLSSLGYSQNLAAIRDLHQAIRTKGETPATLGALVRGYAQLGVLSEFLWDPAHKALKARALLYAQRLVARGSDRPWGLWHRAFALALVGRDRDALADLESARKLGGDTKDKPAWLELINALARYDTKRFEGQKGPGEPQAALLRMIGLEYPPGRAINVQASRAVLSLDPLCLLACDAMCEGQGVSTQHVSTALGPQVLEQVFLEDLASLESLPGSLRDRLGAGLPVRELPDLLQKAGDPDNDSGEPSWSVLAHLIRETQFVQVWRRLHFMKVMWSVPVDEYWKEVKASVTSHRYRPYLETLALPPQVSSPAFRQFAERIDLSDIEMTARAMISLLERYPAQRGKAAWNVAVSHSDNTAREMASILLRTKQEFRLRNAESLMEVSPDHPLARATLIELAWDRVKDKVDEWEKQSADNPAILRALGQHWFDAKNYEETRRVLKRYIEKSPDYWGYAKLADSYKAQGDLDHWRETLDEFLNKVEDLGLDHAKVRVEVAEYYMSRKVWDKAMVYAEDAAESWAGWAMVCAARCAEGAKNWERAESWYQRNAERYPKYSFGDWYFFCKRTGHGNLAAAREFTEQYIQTLTNSDGRDTYEAAFYWLDGQHEKAMTVFSKAYKESMRRGDGLCLAVLVDETRDAARRNTLLKEIVTKNSKSAPNFIKALQYVLDTVLDANVDNKAFDPKELDRLIEACSKPERSFADFLIAGFLKNHGQPDTAQKLYERCADSTMLWEWWKYIAKDTLKTMKDK